MKKWMSVIIAGALAMALLAGCGSSSNSSSGSSSSAAGTDASSIAESIPDTTEAAASDSSAAPSDETGSAGTTGEEADAAGTDASEATSSGNSRSLIVYFDYSENMGDTSGMSVDAITSASLSGGTYDGVTENNLLVMRDEIQKQTGADVYSVRVNEPYDPDYNTMVGVAQDDQNDNKQFTFVEPLPDLSNYDTIYMGMPVWWGGLPQPMVCLLDQYDFSDKVIIPFGINLGSGFGRMISQIEEAEPNAMVNENGLTENAHKANAEVVSDVDSWLAGL